MLDHTDEHHRSHRAGWLRAAVLGANDGILSTSSLVVGVAAAGTGRTEVLVAGLAGLVAGAMSMAAGEYVSVSSQTDAENADLAKERKELAEMPEAELEELTRIYQERGLTRDLAQQVAAQLTAQDALGAHARDELGISETVTSHPVQAAVVSALTFAAGAVVTAATRTQSLRSIDMAFLGMGAFFALIAVFIFTARKKINAAAPAATQAVSPLKALSSPWAVFGALAIFLYVGSEVAIGGMLTNFLESPDVLNAPIETAGKMVALYWGGAMVGRFIGSAVLTRVPAGIVLAVCTVAAALLCLVVSQVGGPTAAYAALSIGLFNSIMFPTIFTLTLERSTAPTSATSGLLVFGIIGGALLPQVAARIADAAGALQPAFIVPLLGYVGLTVFAIAAARTKVRDADVVKAPSPH